MNQNNDEQIYAITNLEGYAREMREAAATTFSDNHSDIDEYISINQMIGLIKSECIGFDDQERPLLNETANAQIYESTVTWINNVGLAKLAAQGFVECAWDDKQNEMIFWTNKQLDNIDHNGEKSNDKPTRRRRKKKKDI